MKALAVILLAPWFAVLGSLYWLWPARHQRRHSRAFDIVALLLASAFSIAAMLLGLQIADTSYGSLWPQILASLLAYKAFLLVLLLAVWRQRRH
jgi:hypothetical protein